MAKKKGTTRKKRDFIYFPEVTGKVVESIEIDPDAQAITILFEDRTALSFDLDPSLIIYPELSDWKTGNWKGIKRWRPIHSKVLMVKW